MSHGGQVHLLKHLLSRLVVHSFTRQSKQERSEVVLVGYGHFEKQSGYLRKILTLFDVPIKLGEFTYPAIRVLVLVMIVSSFKESFFPLSLRSSLAAFISSIIHFYN